jgi:hypothetical protein
VHQLADLARRAGELEIERAQPDELALRLALALETDGLARRHDAGKQLVAGERAMAGLDVEDLEREDVERALEVGVGEKERRRDALAAPARVPLRGLLDVRERQRVGDGGQIDVGALRSKVGADGAAVDHHSPKRRAEHRRQLRTGLGDDTLGRDPPRHRGADIGTAWNVRNRSIGFSPARR